MKKLALSFAALVLGAGAAFAQAPVFADVDTNSDGAVSYEELVAIAPDLTEDAFATYDLNADGTLDEVEFAAFAEAWTAAAPAE